MVQLCAFALSITVKNIVLLLLRRNWYVAFYRTKPGAANIMSVILESLFLSLSTGYIISRAVTLICLSFLYVARIDTPFLADGVGGFGLDKFPVAFRTDILLHEAVSPSTVLHLYSKRAFGIGLTLFTLVFVRLVAPTPLYGTMGFPVSDEASSWLQVWVPTWSRLANFVDHGLNAVDEKVPSVPCFERIGRDRRLSRFRCIASRL